MAASNIKIKLAETATTKSYELSICKLYLHHAWREPSQTHLTILRTSGHQRFGETVANNWTVHDGPDPKASAVVARAQGSHMFCSDWHNSFTLAFEVDWLKGSTLLVMGTSVQDGQWGIVGGTGYFTMAQGYINKGPAKNIDTGSVIELEIYAIFRTSKPMDFVQPPVQPYRDGPKGGPGGQYKNEPKREPHRLERFKLNHGNCIVSFEFSYIDKDGNRQTEGPWGGSRVWKFDEVKLGPNEFVKEVSGTVGQSEGYTVVTSLKFITNVQTYGPYGRENGTPFSLPEKKNGNVVGFFGSSGGLLDYIGVFVRP
ncbi:unnamed protein product [Urochloa decumbens]|uniref:Dirigent protein n=1 Tax=Urochloa decumbens TaxID=240449 RepID=A0ABC9DQG7_9POAL